jgi:hypothetical protein
VRIAALTLAVSLISLPTVAEDGFGLNLDALPIAVAKGTDVATPQGTERLSLDAKRSMGSSPSTHDLVYRSAATPRTNQELRLALWGSPMGRLHYERAAAESMLGREGLVGGGRMASLGMATAALGDGDPGGLQLLVTGESWKSLSPADRAQAGLQASFAAALLYFMADSVN